MSHRRVEMWFWGCLWRVNGGLGLFVRRSWEPEGRPDGPKGRIFDRGASDEGCAVGSDVGGGAVGSDLGGGGATWDVHECIGA